MAYDILQRVCVRVQDSMDEILTNFSGEAKITVLVRTPGKPTADFCMTSDDLDEVLAMVHRRKGDVPPAPQLAGIEEGIERAARYIERQRDDYVQEFGNYDPSTGVTEFSTAGEEHISTLGELIEGIRALHEQAPPPAPHLAGLADAIAEHVRQIEVEGWSPEHDDQHDDYSLAKAASVYAACAAVGKADRAVMDLHGLRGTPGKLQELWPLSWDISWLKPRNRRRDLIKAAALIIAEIERLDRAATKSLEESDND